MFLFLRYTSCLIYCYFFPEIYGKLEKRTILLLYKLSDKSKTYITRWIKPRARKMHFNLYSIFHRSLWFFSHLFPGSILFLIRMLDHCERNMITITSVWSFITILRFTFFLLLLLHTFDCYEIPYISEKTFRFVRNLVIEKIRDGQVIVTDAMANHY